jgi:hypothetical protein
MSKRLKTILKFASQEATLAIGVTVDGASIIFRNRRFPWSR